MPSAFPMKHATFRGGAFLIYACRQATSSAPEAMHLTLPDDLAQLGKGALDAASAPRGPVEVRVPDGYLSSFDALAGFSEVLAIQRLLTLASQADAVEVRWGAHVSGIVLKSPTLFPLLAVLLCLSNARHSLMGEPDKVVGIAAARKAISSYRLARDLLSDHEIVVCADTLGRGTPEDFYRPRTGELRGREDIETVLQDALVAHGVPIQDSERGLGMARAVGVVVTELFENTNEHARLDLERRPVLPNGLRGFILKRLKLTLPTPKVKGRPHREAPRDCLELSVFDSGPGYFSAYTQRVLDASVSIKDEWKVLHNCLERHYHADLPDFRPGHRGMGLNEVLRAIQSAKGIIEIRTGRLYGSRTFVEGTLQAQMQTVPDTSVRAVHTWPKPTLLDHSRRYVAQPQAHEPLIGSSIRVVLPLDEP
jgi:hypothetical protein